MSRSPRHRSIPGRQRTRWELIEFIERYPESPQAGDALFKIAELQRAKADSLGRYSALAEQERSQWKTLLDSSIASAEEAIKKYPESVSLALALQTLLQSQRMLLGAELKTGPQVEEYSNLLQTPPRAQAREVRSSSHWPTMFRNRMKPKLSSS